MQRPITRQIQPEDLEVCTQTLQALKRDRQLLIAKATQEIGIFELSFWDTNRYSWHNNVPNEHMYYFQISHTEAQADIDELISWLEREIPRAEQFLVNYYVEHEGSKKNQTVQVPSNHNGVTHHNSALWHRLRYLSSMVVLMIVCWLCGSFQNRNVGSAVFLLAALLHAFWLITSLKKMEDISNEAV
ncbi:MAG: hypothetical protein WC477_01755 [Patescibacteria group bacterium]